MPFLDQQSPNAHTAHIVLAHGAGAPMDSPWMNAFAELLVARSLRVTRFEFAYMAARRSGSGKSPPPRADKLLDEYRAVLNALTERAPSRRPMLIGGKSMGGRVASMIADELYAERHISGLICLGYPFHPPMKPGKLRTAHLGDICCPTLILQGERDPLGNRSEVATYSLSPSINFHWAPDGDHDLKPRKSSGRTLEDNLVSAADEVFRFAKLAGDNGLVP